MCGSVEAQNAGGAKCGGAKCNGAKCEAQNDANHINI